MPAADRRLVLVLSVAPVAKGFGYVLFEGEQRPVDWGVKEVRGRDKNRGCLRKAAAILDWYRPDVLVVEDMAAARRAARIRELVPALRRLARRRGLRTAAVPRTEVRALFAPLGARNKDAVAAAVCRQLPELEPWLPPPRKIWKSEDARMALFEAAALAFTYYARRRERRARPGGPERSGPPEAGETR